ncbi:DUF1643 domain-containing protein [Pontibacter sp. MBLB2868]|uniref:DUF1643 domain-containing protein n=1 Tax=Pontibacter sp. MBLB2868 TaxID=3451555 RepID=UPI003F755EB5
MEKAAVISKDERYRYVLWRIWDSELKHVTFIGLNPSYADGRTDDPTIKKLIKLTKSWGYGGFYIVNLFALRATDPNTLYHSPNPTGNDNDEYIKKYSETATKIILMWGNHGVLKNRDKEVLGLIHSPYCIGYNKNGTPKHPLYLKSNSPLLDFQKQDSV